MPCLAAIVMAAFFFVHGQFNVKGIAMPVVIETGRSYEFSEIYSSITVPSTWDGDCYDQSQLVYNMAKYFNSQLNGNQRKSEEKLLEIKDKWECVT